MRKSDSTFLRSMVVSEKGSFNSKCTLTVRTKVSVLINYTTINELQLVTELPHCPDLFVILLDDLLESDGGIGDGRHFPEDDVDAHFFEEIVKIVARDEFPRRTKFRHCNN